jgi:hypothetical protein
MSLALASILSLAPAAQHAHASGQVQECSCAQHEPDHPFTIDCNNAAPIRAATVTLETTCASAVYEWGGVFSTPSDAYKWVSQAVNGAYADPEMKLVVFSVDTADSAHLLENAAAAATLMAGTCTAVNTQGNIPAPTAAGACYTLTFPTDVTVDFHATVSTAGVANVAFFTAHGPTEFERDTHYFMSTDLATDIEPAAQTYGKEYNCKSNVDANGLNVCAQAFFIIQSHHDYCPHDTLTRYEEELFHAWESKCVGCNIVRKYDATLNNCPVIDCLDTTVAALGHDHLHENCVAADVSYPFEFAGVFDTSADSYTWVSQAATASNDPSSYAYADEYMKIVAIAMTSNVRSALFALQDAADTLMSGTNCPEVTAECTPGAASCATAPVIVPTTAGVCRTVRFPISNVTLIDFHATVNTAGVAHVALFTAHGPTEFERDMHYFMSTDLATDIEPANTLGAAAAHDHGRRMSEVSMNDRRSRRRLANSGSCCNNATQQGAWKQVVAYHDLCAHDQVPSYIEAGFHDYEASCENYFCNLIGPGIDQTVCPYSPPSPPTSPPPVASSEIPTGALIGIIVAAVIALLLCICVIFMYCREKEGKPIFRKIDATQTSKAESHPSA